jgi:CheY-like chemotaxis protein
MNKTIQLSVVLVVVEDSGEDFDTVTEAVKRSGVTAKLYRAKTGEAGLALLPELVAVRPVVVLMDLNTPGTDGRTALAVIRADPALKSIPVVVFSTSANPKDVEFCYAAGANAYHIKPVRYPEHLTVLIDVMTYWLSRAVLPAGEGGHS